MQTSMLFLLTSTRQVDNFISLNACDLKLDIKNYTILLRTQYNLSMHFFIILDAHEDKMKCFSYYQLALQYKIKILSNYEIF